MSIPYIAEIRLVILPSSRILPNGSVTAYALLDDGWHTKTFHSSPGAVANDMVEGFEGRFGDDPRVWPIGSPDDEERKS